MRSGVYAITNTETDKMYVGSSVNLQKRLREHRIALCKNSHHSIKMQRAWGKHGAENFRFATLLLCSPKDLLFYEQRAIDAFKSATRAGYNVAATAGSSLGVKHSQETRAKLSIAMRGNKHALGVKPSAETRARLSAAGKGRKKSAEHRAKISASQKGKKISVEARFRVSAANKGRKLSDTLREKISAALKGREFSAEHRAALSASMKGKRNALGTKLTAEARAVISAAKTGRPLSAAHKAAISATKKARRCNTALGINESVQPPMPKPVTGG